MKKDFLSQIADDVITDIENECYPIIERIIDKKCVVCRLFTEPEQENNLFKLYRYIGCQITRTPNWREYLSTLKQKKQLINETDLKKLQNHYFTHKQVYSFLPFPDLDSQKPPERDPGYIANLYNKFTQKNSSTPLKRFDEISAGLIDVTVPFVVHNESNTPFITNDLGVNWHLGIHGLSYDFSMDKMKLITWINFPLSPQVCILFCTIDSTSNWASTLPENSDRGLMIQTNESQHIEFLNKLIFYSAKRFVYFIDRITPKKVKIRYERKISELTSQG